MRKLFASFIMNLFAVYCIAQNVGIGTATPSEKLDVNGNINLNGQLKVNGNAGTSNQILTKDASNNLSWGDMSEYKNIQIFDCPLTTSSPASGGCGTSFFVPAGVTKIWIECWGAGGGGGLATGGGGGGYVAAKLTVTPGSEISLTIGAGGNYGTSTAMGVQGGGTTLSTGGVTLIAYGGAGGTGGTGSDPLITMGASQANGGSFDVIGTYSQYIGFNGCPGGISKLSFMSAGASDFAKIVNYGDGGDAALLPGSGGKGGYRLISTSISQTIYATHYGIQSGGGGGSDPSGGYYGRGGRVIVHW